MPLSSLSARFPPLHTAYAHFPLLLDRTLRSSAAYINFYVFSVYILSLFFSSYFDPFRRFFTFFFSFHRFYHFESLISDRLFQEPLCNNLRIICRTAKIFSIISSLTSPFSVMYYRLYFSIKGMNEFVGPWLTVEVFSTLNPNTGQGKREKIGQEWKKKIICLK